MGYREQSKRSTSAPIKVLAWGLVGINFALLVFLGWHQMMMDSVGRQYGIEERWSGVVLFMLAFAAVEAIAAYAAAKQHYGVSIASGGFVFGIVGFIALMLLAQVGL